LCLGSRCCHCDLEVGNANCSDNQKAQIRFLSLAANRCHFALGEAASILCTLQKFRLSEFTYLSVLSECIHCSAQTCHTIEPKFCSCDSHILYSCRNCKFLKLQYFEFPKTVRGFTPFFWYANLGRPTMVWRLGYWPQGMWNRTW